MNHVYDWARIKDESTRRRGLCHFGRPFVIPWSVLILPPPVFPGEGRGGGSSEAPGKSIPELPRRALEFHNPRNAKRVFLLLLTPQRDGDHSFGLLDRSVDRRQPRLPSRRASSRNRGYNPPRVPVGESDARPCDRGATTTKVSFPLPSALCASAARRQLICESDPVCAAWRCSTVPGRRIIPKSPPPPPSPGNTGGGGECATA